eukprot:2384707-Heterocapsa_arctica.AAC.1
MKQPSKLPSLEPMPVEQRLHIADYAADQIRESNCGNSRMSAGARQAVWHVSTAQLVDRTTAIVRREGRFGLRSALLGCSRRPSSLRRGHR